MPDRIVTVDVGLPRCDFVAPSQIVFGWSRRIELPRLLAPLGRRVFLISGSRALERRGTIAQLIESLTAAGLQVARLASLHREPFVSDVDDAVAALHRHIPGAGDVVLAVGGGATIDLAKAVAALATNRQSDTVRDYLEGIGKGLAIDRLPLPVVAVPTTAGTGSEATKNAVISSHDPPVKKSLRSAWMVPRIALVDPELTCSTPPSVTAASGMDAITQLIESYVSRRATALTRSLALTGLKGVLPALRRAVADANCRPAREHMAQAALLSGIALANSGLGMAHGVAAALGVHGGVAHGLACAVMLPSAIQTNRDACRDDLATIADTLLDQKFGSADFAIDALLEELRRLYAKIGIPGRLSALGVSRAQVPALVRDSRGSSMSGNPRDLTDAELEAILADLV